MAILAIDTSTSWMCIAIKINDDIYEYKAENKNDHSSKLMPGIIKLMTEHGIESNDLECIIVGNGPGSYTGTRIGVTVAKTMAWGLDIPVVPVSSLKMFAYSQIEYEGVICALEDAKRQHVFAATYEFKSEILEETTPAGYYQFSNFLEKITLEDQPIFVGLNIEQYEDEVLNKFPKAIIVSQPNDFLSAKHLISLALNEAEVSAHAVKPDYLRLTQAEANLQKRQKAE